MDGRDIGWIRDVVPERHPAPVVCPVPVGSGGTGGLRVVPHPPVFFDVVDDRDSAVEAAPQDARHKVSVSVSHMGRVSGNQVRFDRSEVGVAGGLGAGAERPVGFA